MRVTQSSSSQEICGVLLLRKAETIGGISDLDPQEVTQPTKISHLKLLLKVMLDEFHMRRVITSDNHIVHIEQQMSLATRGVHKKC